MTLATFFKLKRDPSVVFVSTWNIAPKKNVYKKNDSHNLDFREMGSNCLRITNKQWQFTPNCLHCFLFNTEKSILHENNEKINRDRMEHVYVWLKIERQLVTDNSLFLITIGYNHRLIFSRLTGKNFGRNGQITVKTQLHLLKMAVTRGVARKTRQK